LWAARRAKNREAGLVHGHAMLEEHGTLNGFRLAAGTTTGRPVGPLFRDSDAYKWLEAASWELGNAPSAALVELMDPVIELVEKAQTPEGYLNTHFQLESPQRRFADLRNGHELYCAGHLIQAGVAHYRATGGTRLLAVARRFADHIDEVFGPEKRAGVCGHPEIETALVELFRATDEPRYLRLAETFLDRRGHGLLAAAEWYLGGPAYYQDHTPVRESSEMVGHAVRQLYLCTGVADLALETGEHALFAALERQIADLVRHKLYITGGLGARHLGEAFGEAYELPNDTAYCETCAAIAAIKLYFRMLLATGRHEFAELMERTLYNGFLCGVSLDHERYFYVNPLESRGGIERSPWHGCACCPPNVMRLLSSLDHYFATHTEGAVQLHQYGAYTVSTPAGLELEVRSEYPYGESILIDVIAAPGQEQCISLRVPSFSQGKAKLCVNGRPEAVREEDGYIGLRRRFGAGDTIELTLVLDARLVAAHPRVQAARGAVAVERGPLVYCLEECDAPGGVELQSIRLRPDQRFEARKEPGLLGGTTALHTRARSANLRRFDTLYRSVDLEQASGPAEEAAVRLVPYHLWAHRGAGAMAVWLPLE
jgi:hypothetical protein